MFAAVPDQQRLRESCAGCEQACMPACIRIAGMEGEEAFGCKFGDAVAVRFEIVDQKYVGNAERFDQVALVQCPRQIGQLQTAVTDWARTTKAHSDDLIRLLAA